MKSSFLNHVVDQDFFPGKKNAVFFKYNFEFITSSLIK